LRAADHEGGLQILPRLQGENWASLSDVVGFMMNLELALHVVVLKGQQELDIVQPSVHFGKHINVVGLRQKDENTYIVLRSNFSVTNRSFQRRKMTYNRTKIVTNLMGNDLPFSSSCGRDPSA
jgi:hypothetical protein